MNELLREYNNKTMELCNIKSKIRDLELEIKTLKLDIEFDERYEEKREGLKVKEIPKLVNDLTLKLTNELNELKAMRDKTELKSEIIRLELEYDLNDFKNLYGEKQNETRD